MASEHRDVSVLHPATCVSVSPRLASLSAVKMVGLPRHVPLHSYRTEDTQGSLRSSEPTGSLTHGGEPKSPTSQDMVVLLLGFRHPSADDIAWATAKPVSIASVTRAMACRKPRVSVSLRDSK
jgi:hypothetical protein